MGEYIYFCSLFEQFVDVLLLRMEQKSNTHSLNVKLILKTQMKMAIHYININDVNFRRGKIVAIQRKR